jgi:putative phosphoesterase
MKIGVISDTHGVVDRTRLAIEVFEREAVEAIFHCGDVGSLDVLQLFVGKLFWFLWGNTDHPDPSWRRAVQAWGLSWPEQSPLRIERDGSLIAVAHGHEMNFRQTFRSPGADFLFYGHSHTRAVVSMGDCIIVNPGAIHRTPLPTVAIVDLPTGLVRHLDLQGREVEVD